MGKSLTVETFMAHKDFYHSVCAKMIASDLGAQDEAEAEASASIAVWKGMIS